MASKLTTPTLLKTVVRRGYAAQAAVQQPYVLPSQDAKVTTLPSGAVVASVENNAPVSKVALVFKAGSRYETASSNGAAHVLRTSAGLATKNSSSFAITRSIQQAGGSLTAESGREHVLYNLDMIRDNLDNCLGLLTDVGTQPSFKAWELGDNLKRVGTELAMRDPSTIALEMLHGAAFRNSGLGHSIFVPEHQFGKLSPDVMSEFFASTHLASRMAVVGLGVDHEALVSYAKGLPVASGAGAAGASSYGSGELRHETGAAVTCVAVAGAGASIGTSDAAALAVAQQILGIGPSTKYGSNASSILAKTIAATGCVGSASAININYSDNGLFGYFVMADSASVAKIITAVHSAVKGLKVSDADVARGKTQAKAAVHMACESSGELLQDMGLQALLTGKYANPSAAVGAIDAVTPAAVRSALQKALGGKLSMGAIGSLSTVPYLDQL